jgi:hypothetical protein
MITAIRGSRSGFANKTLPNSSEEQIGSANGSVPSLFSVSRKEISPNNSAQNRT